MFNDFVELVREIYPNNEIISLHAPVFNGNEKQYLSDSIDSTFVSTVGQMVGEFENQIASYVGVTDAIATMNGTAALHAALLGVGVARGDEVITQSLSFVATCNAIMYCGADPVFVDVDGDTASLSATSLAEYLYEQAELRDEGAFSKSTGKRISACVPMHTFGLAANIHFIKKICDEWNIELVEDSAEALGTVCAGQMAGSIGKANILSFNGNKVLTTGGGGMILTNNKDVASKIRHLTTTARTAELYRFSHDQVGYNYRMPNLNAALGIAQFEQLGEFLNVKRRIAKIYQDWAEKAGVRMLSERAGTHSNYWLNALLFDSIYERDEFLEHTNNAEILTRAAWDPLHVLPMYRNCARGDLHNTMTLYHSVVNIPSGVPVVS
ncbi:MAG: perosamine synthetase [Parasphingorhabdus sp.]|jgi:perosamine synthetase